MFRRQTHSNWSRHYFSRWKQWIPSKVLGTCRKFPSPAIEGVIMPHIWLLSVVYAISWTPFHHNQRHHGKIALIPHLWFGNLGTSSDFELLYRIRTPGHDPMLGNMDGVGIILDMGAVAQAIVPNDLPLGVKEYTAMSRRRWPLGPLFFAHIITMARECRVRSTMAHLGYVSETTRIPRTPCKYE